MATREGTMQFLADQARLGARLSYRKMFGEYALYVDGVVVALVCDDTLFVKPTAPGTALLGTVTNGAPYPGAKPHLLVRDEVDDPDLLRQLLLATAAALPPPAAKKKTKKKAAKGKSAKKTPPRRAR
jgi:TfoX/Sxy family transcriptional regulator of competence genes